MVMDTVEKNGKQETETNGEAAPSVVCGVVKLRMREELLEMAFRVKTWSAAGGNRERAWRRKTFQPEGAETREERP